MKIGIIIDSIDDAGAGITTYTSNLIKHILDIDKENEYYLIHYKKRIIDKRAAGEIIIPMQKLPFYRQFRKIFLFPRVLKRYNLDVVHETTQIGPFFFNGGYKKIVTIHDLVPLVYPRTQGLLSFFQHRIGLKIILRKIDKVITVSENTKKDILKYFRIDPKKIISIPEAAGEEFVRINERRKLESFKRKKCINYPFLLYVGTLEPRKDIPTLLRAFSVIREKFPKHKLIVVGKKGWKYKKIFHLIKKLNLKEDIIFTGFISKTDLIMYYNTAELFICPSLYEGFGLPVLEAMQCGCPVLATGIPSTKEILDYEEVLFEPGNVKMLEEKMEFMLTDASFRNKIRKKGVGIAKKFSWERCANSTIDIYKIVAGDYKQQINNKYYI